MLRTNNMCDCSDDNRLRAGGYSVLRRARKAYKCCECGVKILPEEQYYRTDGVWEEGADSFQTCLSCEAVREKVLEQPTECILAFGCLEEYIYEELTDRSEEESEQGPCCTIGTTVSWLRRVRGRFELVS